MIETDVPASPYRQAFTLKWAAKRLCLPISTLRRWLDEGLFPGAFRLQGETYIQRDEMLSWLAAYAPEKAALFETKLVFPHLPPTPPGSTERHPDAGNRCFDVYGLPVGEYDKLWRHQGGQCAMCGRAGTLTKNGPVGLVIDHDHVTGRVRGLLCGPCNTALGVYEGMERDRAEAYLRKPPAAEAGVVGFHRHDTPRDVPIGPKKIVIP